MKPSHIRFTAVVAALIMTNCDGTDSAGGQTGPVAGGGTDGVAGSVAGGSGVAVTGGIGAVSGGEGGGGGGGIGGGGGTGGVISSGGSGGGVAIAGSSGDGDGGTSVGGDGGGGAGGVDPFANLAPSTRNPGYPSLAPAVGEPLPSGAAGTWTYQEVAGAISRDGSPAGFYFKYSNTMSKNLLIYLVGGGACQSSFFCTINPPNKDFSLLAESAMDGIANLTGPTPEAQDPRLPRWQSGIFKDDPSNPVKDWNMVYIPYVTGDVFAGNKPNGSVPGVTGTFQFVGRENMKKFIARIVPTFSDAKVVLLTGSSAGGIGALISSPLVVDAFIDQGKGARVFVVDDAGQISDDQYLEVCLQKRWRDIWNLNESFPAECTGCFNADGGGIVAGFLAHLIERYPGNLLGGLVGCNDDEIMEMFFADENDNCTGAAPFSLWNYDQQRFKDGLKDLIDNHMERISTYIWAGRLHQNLFQTASADRFYQKNGLSKTPAEWLKNLLTGQEEHLGTP